MMGRFGSLSLFLFLLFFFIFIPQFVQSAPELIICVYFTGMYDGERKVLFLLLMLLGRFGRPLLFSCGCFSFLLCLLFGGFSFFSGDFWSFSAFCLLTVLLFCCPVCVWSGLRFCFLLCLLE